MGLYNVKSNQMGTLLNHYQFNAQRVRFVQEYELKIDEKALDEMVMSKENKMINSEDNEYILDAMCCNGMNDEMEIEEKISFYFEFSKKIMVRKLYANEDRKESEDEMDEFECHLWINLIDLPQNMDKVLIECNVYCDDLNQQVKFEPVWASKESDNLIGGLVLGRNLTKSLKGLASLNFVITLKILQTNAVR